MAEGRISVAPQKHILSSVRALRLRGPLDGDLRAGVLHGLSVGLLLYVCVIWFPIIWPLIVTRRGANLAGTLFDLLAYAGVLVLLRLGSLRSAIWLFLSAGWQHATTLITLNGGMHSPVLVEYLALPIVAAWLVEAGVAGGGRRGSRGGGSVYVQRSEHGGDGTDRHAAAALLPR
jgi:hypothetical protein